MATSTENRSSRRRAETRARLLVAARDLFAARGVDAVRTGEIAERADVGAGSFYNHFADRQAIIEAVIAEVAEEQGAQIDRLTADVEDPAEVVAYAHRHLIGLTTSDPSFAQLVVRLDASHRLLTESLGLRATRDIQSGIDKGRFQVEDVNVAFHATGGALIGTMRGVLDGDLSLNAAELHAASVLRMLGVDPDEALAISRATGPASSGG